MKISGKCVTHTVQEQVTSNWSLMEAIMRCGDAIEKHEFTILDELDKIKKGHSIKYSGKVKIPFGDDMVSVKKYDQIGEGYLPWSYYIDESGRLLLAINGLRAYILDDAAPADHEKIAFSVSKNKKKKSKSTEERVFNPELVSEQNRNTPNILLITTDQQTLNTISAYGNSYVNTPNLDRLAKKGIGFMCNYSTNPVCSPARSSIFTSRTTCETGVIYNGLGIRENIPNISQWLSATDYETVYSGKWHVPEAYPVYINGFTVLSGGFGGQGTLGDQGVSSTSAGWLMIFLRISYHLYRIISNMI